MKKLERKVEEAQQAVRALEEELLRDEAIQKAFAARLQRQIKEWDMHVSFPAGKCPPGFEALEGFTIAILGVSLIFTGAAFWAYGKVAEDEMKGIKTTWNQ